MDLTSEEKQLLINLLKDLQFKTEAAEAAILAKGLLIRLKNSVSTEGTSEVKEIINGS